MKYIKKIFILTFWLLVWQLLYNVVNKEIFIASPLAVLKNLCIIVMEKNFWFTTFTSIRRILTGFSLSIIFGFVLAFFCYKIKFFYILINPLLTVIRSIPVASFIILAIIWIPSSNVPILVSFIMVMPIVYNNIYQGLCSVDFKLIEMGSIFNLSQSEVFFNITGPSLFPFFITSLKTGIGIAWKSGIAAEIIVNPVYGIGKQLNNSKTYLDTVSLFSWTIIVVCLSFLFEIFIIKLLSNFERNVNHDNFRKN